ncbi:hypothetical protein D3C81_1374480 [compost metagenome]
MVGADHQYFLALGQLTDRQPHAGRDHTAQHLHTVLMNEVFRQAYAIGSLGLIVIDDHAQTWHLLASLALRLQLT